MPQRAGALATLAAPHPPRPVCPSRTAAPLTSLPGLGQGIEMLVWLFAEQLRIHWCVELVETLEGLEDRSTTHANAALERAASRIMSGGVDLLHEVAAACRDGLPCSRLPR